ncbi:MAG: hypothetical protein JWQ81_4221 [Amycolatopsis sp.]|jgi:hypothetical protein|uniref:DUF3574 domain-containing protein n=1 Tax=Amycolatopsis sp. TaxID=37632 RepID=UPI00262B7AF9|nr:DUF3574 domain-containing protein [Amycolatopsis sp.]MCU1683482.1 hypothetical protein [Amycolatopsis sp.]
MAFSRRTALVLAVTAAVGLGGGVSASAALESPTTAAAAASQTSPGDLWKRTELYFGTGKPDGSAVTPAEFENFSEKEITAAFPDGFTELTGKGQYKGASGEIVREQSFVVIVLYPFTDKNANGEIEAIRTDYKRLFEQESVLRTDTVQQVSF